VRVRVRVRVDMSMWCVQISGMIGYTDV